MVFRFFEWAIPFTCKDQASLVINLTLLEQGTHHLFCSTKQVPRPALQLYLIMKWIQNEKRSKSILTDRVWFNWGILGCNFTRNSVIPTTIFISLFLEWAFPFTCKDQASLVIKLTLLEQGTHRFSCSTRQVPRWALQLNREYHLGKALKRGERPSLNCLFHTRWWTAITNKKINVNKF